MSEEWWLVINKANEETHCLYQENPNVTPNPAGAISLTKPNRDPNSVDLNSLEDYRWCILERLKKGVSKQKSLNMMYALQQKSNKVPSELLSGLLKAH